VRRIWWAEVGFFESAEKTPGESCKHARALSEHLYHRECVDMLHAERSIACAAGVGAPKPTCDLLASQKLLGCHMRSEVSMFAVAGCSRSHGLCSGVASVSLLGLLGRLAS
jgi:hypothetical protein